MINQVTERPYCDRCRRSMTEIHAWEKPPPPKHLVEGVSGGSRIRAFFESPVGLAVFSIFALAPALSFALDPRWRWLGIGYLLPAALFPLFLGSYIIGSVAASFREVRDLIKDRRTRVIHGIEHATVVMLLRRGFQVRGGQTDDGYFKLWLQSDRREGKKKPKTGATEDVRKACVKAIDRLRRERWSLAIHRRCGTTWMVLFLLAALAAISSVAIGLFTTLQPVAILKVAGAFLALLVLGARPLGYLMQRTMTIAVDFQRATVQRIVRCVEESGVVCYYVHLDVELPGGALAPARSRRAG